MSRRPKHLRIEVVAHKEEEECFVYLPPRLAPKALY
jgi:hypothetical protein